METFSALLAIYKGQWRGALMFSLIWAWIKDWVNSSEAGDLRCHHTHYDVIVMMRWVKVWAMFIYVTTALYTNSETFQWPFYTSLSSMKFAIPTYLSLLQYHHSWCSINLLICNKSCWWMKSALIGCWRQGIEYNKSSVDWLWLSAPI